MFSVQLPPLVRHLLVLLLLAWPGQSLAAVPHFNAATENVLLLGGKVTATAAASRGSWKTGGGELQATRGAVKGGGFWIFGGKAGLLKDGLFRVRFKRHRKLDLTLLTRAGSGGDSGYGLRLRRGSVSLVSLEGGNLRDLTRPRKLGWVNGRKQLEVVLYALGPHLMAALFEAPKGRAIMVLTAGGLRPTKGRVGMVLGRRHDQRARMVLATTRPACKDLPPAKVNWLPHIIAQVPASAAQVADNGKVLEQLPGDPARLAVRASPAGVERLFCGAGGVHALSPRIPWKYFDLDYLKSTKAKLPLTKPAYPLHQAFLSPKQVETFLRSMRKRHQDDSMLKVLGRTHQGRPLYALGVGKEIRKNPQRPSMLMVGAHHGNEPLSLLFVLAAAQNLLEGASAGDKQARRWLAQLNVWFVPLANPDGLNAFLFKDRFHGRKNGRDRHPLTGRNIENGVDLNRNYPFHWRSGTKRASSGDTASRYYRGPKAGSEPETQAIMDLALRERFVGVLTFHSGTVALLAPYTIDDVKNPEPNEAWVVAEELIKDLPPHPQGKPWLVRRNLYSVDGTDQDWHRFATGAVALLVEGARWAPRKARTRAAVLKAMQPLWARLFDRFLDGPSISGKVLDSDGNPVKAEVVIKEAAPQQGERWTTRPRDGTFHRYLAEPGKYTLLVTTAHGRSVSRAVTVEKGRVEVEITVPATGPPP